MDDGKGRGTGVWVDARVVTGLSGQAQDRIQGSCRRGESAL